MTPIGMRMHMISIISGHMCRQDKKKCWCFKAPLLGTLCKDDDDDDDDANENVV